MFYKKSADWYNIIKQNVLEKMRNDCEKFIIIIAAQFWKDKNMTNKKTKTKRNRKNFALKIEK